MTHPNQACDLTGYYMVYRKLHKTLEVTLRKH